MELEAPIPETVDEAVDELQARFLNLPRGEILTVARVFMQIQQAHWYYEDEYADEYATEGLPHLSFTDFSRLMFERSPMLSEYCFLHADFKQQFKEYMANIPKYGCILLNAAMSHVLLVCSFGGKSWSFPRGKVNQGESGIECAAREAEEETGFNSASLLQESHSLTRGDDDAGGSGFIKLYIAVGVPDDGSFDFAPTTRKEVAEVGWAALADMDGYVAYGPAPGSDGTVLRKMKLWGVAEWLPALRGWINKQRARGTAGNGKGGAGGSGTTTGKQAKARAKAGRSDSSGRGGGASGATASGGASAATGLAPSLLAQSMGGKGALLDAPLSNQGRWTVDDMFKQNAKLLGVQFQYDGNPHNFGDYERHGQVAVSGGAGAGAGNGKGGKGGKADKSAPAPTPVDLNQLFSKPAAAAAAAAAAPAPAPSAAAASGGGPRAVADGFKHSVSKRLKSAAAQEAKSSKENKEGERQSRIKAAAAAAAAAVAAEEEAVGYDSGTAAAASAGISTTASAAPARKSGTTAAAAADDLTFRFDVGAIMAAMRLEA